MKARRSPGLEAKGWAVEDPQAALDVQPGDFEITSDANGQRWFWLCCPGPCGSVSPLALRPVVHVAAQSWEWDGNEEAPTLTPSINHVGCWHGWLKAGEFA